MQRNRGRAHRRGLGRSSLSRWNGSRGLGAAVMRTTEELRCSGGSFLPRLGTLHLHGGSLALEREQGLLRAGIGAGAWGQQRQGRRRSSSESLLPRSGSLHQ
jgi:hypothetical protein